MGARRNVPLYIGYHVVGGKKISEAPVAVDKMTGRQGEPIQCFFSFGDHSADFFPERLPRRLVMSMSAKSSAMRCLRDFTTKL